VTRRRPTPARSERRQRRPTTANDRKSADERSPGRIKSNQIKSNQIKHQMFQQYKFLHVNFPDCSDFLEIYIST